MRNEVSKVKQRANRERRNIVQRAKVNAYKYGNVIEMTNVGNSRESTIKPISKEEFVQLSTGEIKKFQRRNELRVQSPINLKKHLDD